jgi:hypothetical protein
MFTEFFRVYKPPYSKKRVGKDNDGGYIICDIPNIQYDLLLSAGICNDISFEEQFLDLYPNVPCFAFDGTITTFPSTTKPISFIPKNIGPQTTLSETSLLEYISHGQTIFLKMDIEGAEVPWITSLPEEAIDRFAQISMEWHNPFYLPIEQYAFARLQKTHVLVHFHGNNCREFENVEGVKIPYTFECTYIHKKYYTGPILYNQECIPTSLDMPCDSTKPDLVIDYPPFVNKP